MSIKIQVELDRYLEEMLNTNTEDIVKEVLRDEVRKHVRKALVVRGFDYDDVIMKISNDYIESLSK